MLLRDPHFPTRFHCLQMLSGQRPDEGSPFLVNQPTVVARSEQLLQRVPELAQLSGALRAYARNASLALPALIKITNAAVLASTLPWEAETSVLQVVHASPNIYRRPWFDCVKFLGSGNQDCFGKLVCMFTTTINGIGQQLAFVRLFKIRSAHDALTKHGFTMLAWQLTSASTASQHRSSARGPMEVGTPVYQVIPLAAIVCREFVIQNFGSTARGGPDSELFYVSKYKW